MYDKIWDDHIVDGTSDGAASMLGSEQNEEVDKSDGGAVDCPPASTLGPSSTPSATWTKTC